MLLLSGILIGKRHFLEARFDGVIDHLRRFQTRTLSLNFRRGSEVDWRNLVYVQMLLTREIPLF